jgi:hypothetical protein
MKIGPHQGRVSNISLGLNPFWFRPTCPGRLPIDFCKQREQTPKNTSHHVEAPGLGLQQLGYKEFSAARRIVLGGVFGSVLSAQLALEAFENEMLADITLHQCWDLVCRTCSQFGFSGIDFYIEDVKHQCGIMTGWQARLDFPGHGYINLWRESGAQGRGAAAVLFMDCVLCTFNQKLSQMEAVLYE